MFFIFYLIAQNLPWTWSPSYATFDVAQCLNPGEYSIGLGIDNYCIYSPAGDTIAYDERRFDIWMKSGVVKRLELELKYSYPTAGLISLKVKLLEKLLDSAVKLGVGYMKGTRVGYITDYVYDLYGYLFLTKELKDKIKIIYTPKFIYSLHYRDRQEHSTRPPRFIFHVGHCLGMALGNRMEFMPEVNWVWGNNEGKKYIVNQFGLGANLKL